MLNGLFATSTNQLGRFRLDRVEGGLNLIEARRVGFRAHVAEVELSAADDSVVLGLELAPLPIRLKPIVVDAEHTVYVRGRLEEFFDRRRGGLGHYFTRWEIEGLNPQVISDVLRVVPGVRVSPGAFGSTIVRLGRGTCSTPRVFLDGMRITDSEVDDLVLPGEVQGIEVYAGPGTAPVQYSSFSGCGVVLIWTR